MSGCLNVSGLLIDMDGLLLDTERVSLRCWQQTEDETGFFMPDGFYLGVIGQSLKTIRDQLLKVMHSDCDVDHFLEIAGRIYTDTLKYGTIPVKPGASEFLQWLNDARFPRCLVTSTGRELCELKLEVTGLGQFLPYRVCGDEVTHGKPAPDIYLEAAGRLHQEPSKLLALEDSPNGLMSAMAAGCMTLHVPDLAPLPLELGLTVNRNYRDLSEVLSALKRAEVRLIKS